VKFKILFSLLVFLGLLASINWHLYQKYDKKNSKIASNKSYAKKLSYVSELFWKNVTPEQLEETLKNMENVNQNDNNNRNILHFLILSGKKPEIID